MLTIACLGFIFLIYPIFMLFNTKIYAIVLGAQIFMAILLAAYSGAVPVVIAEQFHIRTRNTSMSMGYNLNVMLFLAPAPMFATWLINVTGTTLSLIA